MMRTRHLPGLGLLACSLGGPVGLGVSAGCDLPDLSGLLGPSVRETTPEGETTPSADTGGEIDRSGTPGKSGTAPDAAACLEDCLAAATRSTDRETCRLQCGNAGRGEGASQAHPIDTDAVLARYTVCVDGCERMRGTDRTTCALTCVGSTLSTDEGRGPLGLDRERACLRPCLERLAKCRSSQCTAPGTNGETCRLQCETQARPCVDRCAEPGSNGRRGP